MKGQSYQTFFRKTLCIKPWLTVFSVLLNIGIFGYSAVNASCVRKILNSLEEGKTGNGILSRIWIFLILMVIAAVVRCACIMGSAYVDNLRAFYYENNLRTNMIECILKRKNIKEAADTSSRIFETVDDDAPMTVFPPELLTEVTGFVVFTLIAIGSLLIINWRVTVFIFIPLSANIFVIKKISGRIKSSRKANRDIHEDVTITLSDTINSIMSIKTLDAEQAVLEHYDHINQKRKRIVLKDVLFQSIVSSGVDAAVLVCTVVMMLAVAKLMSEGQFPIGDFAIFICYLDTLASCISRVIELYTETKKSEVTYQRILSVVDEEQSCRLTKKVKLSVKDKDSHKIQPDELEEGLKKLEVLEVEQLECMYDERRGIKDISFRLEGGKLLAVTGPVGSGKSTVLNAMTGLVPCSIGKLTWNGQKLLEPFQLLKAPDVASCLQKGKLLNASIRENLTLGRECLDEECYLALRQGCFLREVFKMPDGLDTVVGENGSLLSGGQRQRLLLSRMLLCKAKLYLLDDATSALDIETQQSFFRNLRRILQETGAAAIVVTNQAQVLSLADDVLMINEGK